MFPIETHRGSEDWGCLVRAINQGIDSRLEAMLESRFVAGGGDYGKDLFEIADRDLPILIRRLCDAEDEASQELGAIIAEIAFDVECKP